MFWRIIIINFFHCLFVDGEKLCQNLKIQYGNKEIQHGLQLINNGMVLQLRWDYCRRKYQALSGDFQDGCGKVQG